MLHLVGFCLMGPSHPFSLLVSLLSWEWILSLSIDWVFSYGCPAAAPPVWFWLLVIGWGKVYFTCQTDSPWLATDVFCLFWKLYAKSSFTLDNSNWFLVGSCPPSYGCPLLSPPTPVTNWRLPAASQTPAKHPIHQLPAPAFFNILFTFKFFFFSYSPITHVTFHYAYNPPIACPCFFHLFSRLFFVFTGSPMLKPESVFNLFHISFCLLMHILYLWLLCDSKNFLNPIWPGIFNLMTSRNNSAFYVTVSKKQAFTSSSFNVKLIYVWSILLIIIVILFIMIILIIIVIVIIIVMLMIISIIIVIPGHR